VMAFCRKVSDTAAHFCPHTTCTHGPSLPLSVYAFVLRRCPVVWYRFWACVGAGRLLERFRCVLGPLPRWRGRRRRRFSSSRNYLRTLLEDWVTILLGVLNGAGILVGIRAHATTRRGRRVAGGHAERGLPPLFVVPSAADAVDRCRRRWRATSAVNERACTACPTHTPPPLPLTPALYYTHTVIACCLCLVE